MPQRRVEGSFEWKHCRGCVPEHRCLSMQMIRSASWGDCGGMRTAFLRYIHVEAWTWRSILVSEGALDGESLEGESPQLPYLVQSTGIEHQKDREPMRWGVRARRPELRLAEIAGQEKRWAPIRAKEAARKAPSRKFSARAKKAPKRPVTSIRERVYMVLITRKDMYAQQLHFFH
jgi:hypothetical protein